MEGDGASFLDLNIPHPVLEKLTFESSALISKDAIKATNSADPMFFEAFWSGKEWLRTT